MCYETAIVSTPHGSTLWHFFREYYHSCIVLFVILVVEYKIGDGLGHIRYYLAPKMEED